MNARRLLRQSGRQHGTVRALLLPVSLVLLTAILQMVHAPAQSAAHHSSIPATQPNSMPGMRMAPAATNAKAVPPVLFLHRRIVTVTIENFKFSPAQIVVSPGTRVIWTNKDSDPHTVDSTKNVWNSEALDTDSHFTRLFSKTGSFPYYCSIHPFMHGTVTVRS